MNDGVGRGGPEFLRPDGSPPRVLVVDDESDITSALVTAFTYDGWQARGRMDGRSALISAIEFPPDLVVLDITLPDEDGYAVLQRLRALSEQVCVLFLTAREGVSDRVAGISAGADDYVTKPFSILEVLARSRGLLRRAGLASAQSVHRLRVGDLELDEDAREVRRGGDPLELTGTEFELLRFLMRNPRRVLSKEQILDHVWEYDFGGNSHVVELYISYLRKKVDLGRSPMINTVRGFGYVLKPAEQ
ncbi:two-component system OmpR family response regulator [Nakamurella sp. UYEF19]|uniref:response regulator transcription factor n=1 Tax=Nakamurella sp. UYEF19 TaxID=1756392 RepID=UPI0033917116